MSDHPLPPPSTAILDLAEACARFVDRAIGVRLDGTQATLPILDHYLAQVGEDARRGELIGLVAPAAGAYFGEVLRISLGEGSWTVEPDDPESARLLLVGGRLRIAPVEAAFEAILRRVPDEAPPVLEARRDADLVREALADFGEVREEDFFRLAVRYDAIVMVHARLTAATSVVAASSAHEPNGKPNGGAGDGRPPDVD